MPATDLRRQTSVTCQYWLVSCNKSTALTARCPSWGEVCQVGEEEQRELTGTPCTCHSKNKQIKSIKNKTKMPGSFCKRGKAGRGTGKLGILTGIQTCWAKAKVNTQKDPRPRTRVKRALWSLIPKKRVQALLPGLLGPLSSPQL